MGLSKIPASVAALPVCAFGMAMVQWCQAQNNPQDYVDAHNMVGAGPLEWDNMVAVYAQSYANQRAGDCGMVPSEGEYGENLATGSGSFTGADAVALWVGEKQYYDYDTNSCTAAGGGGCGAQMCGHYKQVVWKDTVRLGCARVQCSSGSWFVTCNYDPPGN